MKVNNIRLFLNKYRKKIILMSIIAILGGGLFYFNSDYYYISLYDSELEEKAKKGDAKAQYWYSRRLFRKEISEHNDFYKRNYNAQRNYWHRKSADNGYSEAIIELCQESNSKRSSEEIYYWCSKARYKGDDAAKLYLARLAKGKGEYQTAIDLYKQITEGWFFLRDNIAAYSASQELSSLYLKLGADVD